MVPFSTCLSSGLPVKLLLLSTSGTNWAGERVGNAATARRKLAAVAGLIGEPGTSWLPAASRAAEREEEAYGERDSVATLMARSLL